MKHKKMALMQQQRMTVKTLIDRLQKYVTINPELKEAVIINTKIIDDKTDINDGSVVLYLYRYDVEAEGELTIYPTTSNLIN